MTETLMMGQNARWAVCWLVEKNGKRRVLKKDFEQDLNAAIELYQKVLRANKPMATLLSRNVAFPPPAHLLPYEETRFERSPTGKQVRKRFRKKKLTKKGKWKGEYEIVTRLVPEYHEKKVVDTITPMATINADGEWWCPYCREMRHFQFRKGFIYQGIFVPRTGYYCPICRIGHDNHWVRHYNPEAARLPIDLTPRRLRRG